MVNMVASAGHKLGQIVGDWWEAHVVLPLLSDVASQLGLFLDNRFVERTCRGGKILWPDSDGNQVDYDYVLELDGTIGAKGVPVAFFESFWRRGARHSKDKARDDTNKLLPMRSTYPTARFLAIAACGEFTEPAREYVRSREVELFYISKTNIVAAFAKLGLTIDYPDSLPEPDKLKLVNDLEESLTDQAKKDAFSALKQIVGDKSFKAFQVKVASSLAAMPQEIRLYVLTRTGPVVFQTTEEVRKFLDTETDWAALGGEKHEYVYDVVYTDGAQFSVTASDLDELRQLHSQVETLEIHMRSLDITW
ncbi:hypothetical protein RPE78_11415 [Thioclava litoralis]|uniref:Restriction endonuclease n=1 Tax=Thioclava litoralis TaxID=3076557 RepID=A0ABZ1DZJ2_9RHOB|nr:hypothetical protein RPE78_11415 [Thioclava sp. FTW29]